MYTFSFSVDLTVNCLILPFDTGTNKMLQNPEKNFRRPKWLIRPPGAGKYPLCGIFNNTKEYYI